MKFIEAKLEQVFTKLLGNEGFSSYWRKLGRRLWLGLFVPLLDYLVSPADVGVPPI